MPRQQKPLDPHSGPLAEFAHDLRLLREAAGNVPYRALARRAGFSASTLSVAASGTVLPSLDVTLAYVQACGGDPEPWQRRWHHLAVQSPPSAATPPRDTPADTAAPVRSPAWRRRTPRRLAFAVLMLTGGVALAAILYPPGKPAPPAADSAQASTANYPYDQVTGPGCPDARNATTGKDDSGPRHSWEAAIAQNWTVAQCTDVILYSRPTTEQNPYRWQDDYFWIFSDVPAGDRCEFRIYIPDSTYSHYTASYDWSTSTSYLEQNAFAINQHAFLGRWYRHGPVTFTAGTAVLMLTDARSSSPEGTLTAAPVRLVCASRNRSGHAPNR